MIMGIGTEAEIASGYAAEPVARAAHWPARLLRAATHKGTLSLLDQGIVSGTNFLTTIIIGRICGPEELGIYALVFTIMVLVVCVHQSLLMTPYTMYVNRLDTSAQRTYTGSVLVHQVLLTALTMLVLAGVGGFFWQFAGSPGLGLTVWVLAAGVPFMLLRELGRRFAFAHLRLPAAIGLDGTFATLQMTGLVALATAGWLTAETAFGLIGAACAITGIGWLLTSRREFYLERRQIWPQLQQNWAFGRWVFASQVTFLIHAYLIHWLLAWMHDPSATGIFSACTMIVYLSNPFIQGVGNILYPSVARSYGEGGPRRLRRMVGQATLMIGGTMGLFFVFVLFFGDSLIRLFYGAEYVGHGLTISLLAAGAWVSSLSLAAGHGLWALERPKVNFVASVIGIGSTLLSGIWLVGPGGPLGAAAALLAGHLTSSLFLALTFFKQVNQQLKPVAAGDDLCEAIP